MANLFKEGIRAIGIDDGPLKDNVLLVGVFMRRDRFEGLISTRVKRDGNDATEKILKVIKASGFDEQIHVLFVNGIAVAGLNLVDSPLLAKELKVPVIAVTENEPHPEKVEELVERFPEKLELWKRIKKDPAELETDKGRIWFQNYGCTKRDAERLIRHFIVHSKIPEPVRMAHIIARGIEDGFSRGL